MSQHKSHTTLLHAAHSGIPSGARVRASSIITDVSLRDTALQVTAKVTVETEGAERPALVVEAIGPFQYDS
jgi:hypothetical protein